MADIGETVLEFRIMHALKGNLIDAKLLLQELSCEIKNSNDISVKLQEYFCPIFDELAAAKHPRANQSLNLVRKRGGREGDIRIEFEIAERVLKFQREENISLDEAYWRLGEKGEPSPEDSIIMTLPLRQAILY